MSKKKQLEYLRTLFQGTERELINNKVQVWVFGKEEENPTHIGKDQAKQMKEIHLTRIKHLEAILEAYKNYAWENFEESL